MRTVCCVAVDARSLVVLKGRLDRALGNLV